MKTLTLSLKKKWFDMIKSGVKKEEYREIKPYWKKRLRNIALKTDLSTVYEGFQRYDRLVFTLGYPKSDDMERRLIFKNPKICISAGKPEWGAEHGKEYFVITWGSEKMTNL